MRNMFFFFNKNDYEVVSKGPIFDSACIQLLTKHAISTHQSHIILLNNRVGCWVVTPPDDKQRTGEM